MPRGTSSDGGRHDHLALVIGFAGAIGIVLAFAIILCIGACICIRRYEGNQIQRRSFVKRNIPSKIYYHGGRAAENRSATKESKREIQETAPSESEGGDVCTICLVPFKDRDKISWSTNEHCTHTFHKRCIRSWLFNHAECPICREVFLCEKEEQEASNEAHVVDDQEDGKNASGEAVSPNATAVEDDEEIVVA